MLSVGRLSRVKGVDTTGQRVVRALMRSVVVRQGAPNLCYNVGDGVMKCDHLTCTNDAVVYEIFKYSDVDDVYKWCQTCHDYIHNEWTVPLCGKKEEKFLSVAKEEYVIMSVMKS